MPPTRLSLTQPVHNRQGLSFGDLVRSLSDFDLWPLYLVRCPAAHATGRR
jgi:hypothetical protein